MSRRCGFDPARIGQAGERGQMGLKRGEMNMARPRRSDFQGAIHLITLRGYPGRHVFYDPEIFEQFPENPCGHAPDAVFFQTLLLDTCEQYGAVIHAYVMDPNAALIVIQRHAAPMTWVAHDVLARFSKYLIKETRIPSGEKPFPQRHRAQIVQPSKLPYAVRYVQRRAVSTDPRRRAINHPFSSNLIYCGRKARPECFVVSETRDALERLGYFGLNGYFEFMARRDSPAIAQMLTRHVIGEATFAESVRERSREPATIPCSDEILREVTRALLHAEPGIAYSSTHLGALARALVAWYAMRTGTAQIGTVATWFGITSSDLRYLIRRHRRKNPQYFSRSLPDLFPVPAGPEATSPLIQSQDRRGSETPRNRSLKTSQPVL